MWRMNLPMPVICMLSYGDFFKDIWNDAEKLRCCLWNHSHFLFLEESEKEVIFHQIFVTIMKICRLAQTSICITCLACSNDYIDNKHNTTNWVSFALFADPDSMVRNLKGYTVIIFMQIFMVQIFPSLLHKLHILLIQTGVSFLLFFFYRRRNFRTLWPWKRTCPWPWTWPRPARWGLPSPGTLAVPAGSS